MGIAIWAGSRILNPFASATFLKLQLHFGGILYGLVKFSEVEVELALSILELHFGWGWNRVGDYHEIAELACGL